MVVAELVYAVLEGLPADYSGEVTPCIASMNVSLDASLEVSGPAFIEPEVFPAAVGNEIT